MSESVRTVDSPRLGAGAPGPRLDVESARRVADRLRSELGALIRSFSLDRRRISEMSRWLGVTRPVCQRVVQAVRVRGDALECLAQLPGVQGLAGFVAAAERAGCDASLVEGARAAARAYADLIDRHGGSQARLVADIEGYQEHGEVGGFADESGAEARRAIYEGARALTRREIGTQVGLFMYRPTDADAGLVDCVTAMALLGVRVEEGGMPICPVSTFAQGDPERSPAEVSVGPLDSAGPGPLGRLDRFSSSPPPRVIARRHGGRVAVVVEPEEPGAVFDAALGMRILGAPHPAVHEPRMQTCWVHTDGPTRRLILVVYLHRSMAMRSIAMTGAYIRDRVGSRIPDADGRVHVLTPEELWTVRLPDGPRLEYLGSGLDGLSPAGCAMVPELARHLFGMEGWRASEFVGFRIDVAYPAWGAQYLINFDFQEPEVGD